MIYDWSRMHLHTFQSSAIDKEQPATLYALGIIINYIHIYIFWYLPIAFGSNWYGGIPQWAGGGVVSGSPLWQKKGGNPILFACKEIE